MKLASLLNFLPLVYCIVHSVAQNSFHHFWLVQTWPSGYCASRFCKPRPPFFVIHGLWPVTKNGVTINASENLNASAVRALIENDASLLGNMNRYWPSLVKSNPSLWAREWNKHGSASSYDLLDYFRLTIQLMKSMDLVKTLKGAGLEPSHNGTTYAKSTYKEAINTAVPSDSIILKCYSSVIGDLLEEVMFCTDRQARNFISCNPNESRQENCGPNVTFLLRK